MEPDDVAALVNLGTLECDEGNLEEARVLLGRAAELDPTANWVFADVFIEEDDLDRAAEVLCIAIDAGETKAYLDLAYVEHNRGHEPVAREAFASATAQGLEATPDEYWKYVSDDE